MKSNFWLLGGLAGLAAASVWAQDPARDTNPPAFSRLVTGPLAKDVVLDPPAIATVKTDSLIVRSQPAWDGEQITHVVKGQTVTVLEQITRAKPKPNEPTNWARISLPTNAAVWVFADYVDTNTMTISRARVNVRSGNSDAHDIVARLEKGAPVKVVRRNADWIQIEPPTNAYGFVGGDFLTMQTSAAPPPATVAAVEPAAAAPVAAAPATPEAVAPPATNSTPEATNITPVAAAPVAATPATPEAVAPPATNTTPGAASTTATGTPPFTYQWMATNTPPEATNATLAAASPPAIVAPEPVATAPPPAPTNSTPPAAAVPAAPPPGRAAAATPESADIDPKPRIVTREGTVRKALNIQAPADYELRDLNSGQLIEYLQPDAKEKNFKRFTGIRVSVTGPEWLDRRWPKTPILQIQTLDLMP